MTGHQFDVIINKLEELERKQLKLTEQVEKQNEFLNTIKEKTVVISDVDRRIEQLRLDVGALRDEQEA